MEDTLIYSRPTESTEMISSERKRSISRDQNGISQHTYSLSWSVGVRLAEVLEGGDDHRQTKSADEDIEDTGDVT